MQDARAAPRSYALRARDGPAKPKRRGGTTSAPASSSSSSSSSSKTLVDAFKQHGMKLCDGSRLNAVGKGVHAIGSVPPTLAANVSALYMSQNNLCGLAGIEQFQCVRLLSVGGNLIARVEELDRLAALRHLRNLNLVGNPLCDQPNYRLRVIDQLSNLQVLDAVDVTKKEREAAPAVATQDRAMRVALVRNHFEIHKLQRTAQLIQLHRDLYGFVFAGAQHGRFDWVPGPHDVGLDVKRFVRLWDIEEAFPTHARAALELQMLAIVTRTYRKLSEHPKNKAKEYLAGLAGARPPPPSQQIDGIPAETKRVCRAWDEAYGSVISLQQQTIINLHGVCEHNNRDAVDFMKKFLLANTVRRSTIAQTISRMKTHGLKSEALTTRTGDRVDVQESPASAQLRLPPQQEDPDVQQRVPEAGADPYHGSRPRALAGQVTEPERHVPTRKTETSIPAPKRELSIRSGEFANRTLGEAIHRFTLRGPTEKPANIRSSATALPEQHQPTTQVYTVQHQQANSMFASGFAASSRKLSLNKLQTRAKQLDLPGSTMLYPVYSTSRRESHTSTYDGECSSRFDDESDAMSVAATSDITPSLWVPGDASDASGHKTSKSSPHPGSRRRHPSLPDPHRAHQSNPASGRSIRHSSPRFEDEEKASEPAPALPPLPPPAASEPISSARLQELEQREEKYIKALMESEQRELELRNGMCSLQKKLTYYQRTFRQDLEERQKIKQEVEKRVMTVAVPKILRRFFVQWVRFYSWALQVQHIRRKRAFIVQYDLFWRWRRSIWVKHQVRELVRKRQKRELWVLFGEWANAARLSVIATRSREQQTRRLLRQVVGTWKNAVAVIKFLQCKQDQYLQARAQQLQLRCWKEWERVVQQKRKANELHRLRSREMARSLQQVTLWKWKVYVLAVARPTQARADQLLEQRTARTRVRYFQAWWRICKTAKLQRSCLTRRVWRRWAASYLVTKKAREDEQIQHRVILKQHFLAWRSTAVDRLTSRRALALAKRYVNQRRLRKLWLHWKFFSIIRRKYRQGSTKALKHYFVKLLRHSWRRWKAETSHNLQNIKHTKFRTLRQHFEAFTEGIRRAKRERFQWRLMGHTVKRRRLKQVASCVSAWRHCVTKRKWVTQCGQVLGHQNNLLALGLAWRVWRSARVQHLIALASELRESYEKLVDEKNELEADLMVVDDKILSIQSEKEVLLKQYKEQTCRLTELEHNATVDKEQYMQQRNEQATTIAKLEQRCREWEQRRSLETDKQEGAVTQYHALEKENRELQDCVADLERTLTAEQKAVHDAHDGREKLREDMDKMRQKFDSEMCVEAEKRKALDQELGDLRSQLTQEQKEREETANRLQEYERRIATTCEAINQHEDEHERDKMRLRYEYAHLEAKWREEYARNSELQRLLVEKNELIRTLQDSSRRDSDRQGDSRGMHSVAELAADPEEGDSTRISQGRSPSDRQRSPPEQAQKRLASSPHQISVVRDAPPVDLLLKEISNSPLLRPDEADTPHQHSIRLRETTRDHVSREGESGGYNARSQPPLHLRTRLTTSGKQATRAEELVAREQERLIDERTSKVHDDIRLLQERIARRLEQGVLSVSKLMACRQSVRPQEAAKLSRSSSCTSLSEDVNSSAAESAASLQRAKAHPARRKSKSAALSSHRSAVGVASAPSSSLRRRSGRENTGDSANAASGTRTHAALTRKPTSASISRRAPTATPTLVASARKKKNIK